MHYPAHPVAPVISRQDYLILLIRQLGYFLDHRHSAQFLFCLEGAVFLLETC
jgi:hypothetical protein